MRHLNRLPPISWIEQRKLNSGCTLNSTLSYVVLKLSLYHLSAVTALIK